MTTVYIDVVSLRARAAMTGSALPSVTGTLLSYLAIQARFFSGDDIVAVTDAKCVIKPKDAPAGAAALIDTTADVTEAGTDNASYTFKWPIADSVQLRAAVDAAAPGCCGDTVAEHVELRCEIEFTHEERVLRVAFPILFSTSYHRPEDAAPDATADASWQWLKDRAPESNGFTHNDDQKTLAVEPSASEIGDITGLDAALAGKAAASHAHAQSEVTGLDAALAGKAAASHTHSNASTASAGFMSAADKIKLNGLGSAGGGWVFEGQMTPQVEATPGTGASASINYNDMLGGVVDVAIENGSAHFLGEHNVDFVDADTFATWLDPMTLGVLSISVGGPYIDILTVSVGSGVTLSVTCGSTLLANNTGSDPGYADGVTSLELLTLPANQRGVITALALRGSSGEWGQDFTLSSVGSSEGDGVVAVITRGGEELTPLAMAGLWAFGGITGASRFVLTAASQEVANSQPLIVRAAGYLLPAS